MIYAVVAVRDSPFRSIVYVSNTYTVAGCNDNAALHLSASKRLEVGMDWSMPDLALFTSDQADVLVDQLTMQVKAVGWEKVTLFYLLVRS